MGRGQGVHLEEQGWEERGRDFFFLLQHCISYDVCQHDPHVWTPTIQKLEVNKK